MNKLNKLSDNFYSKMFTLAALWNICISFTGLVFRDFGLTLTFGSFSVEVVTGHLLNLVFYNIFLIAIGIFGAGYYIVSRDLSLNRGIVWLGLVSKIIIFCLIMYCFVTDNAAIMGLLQIMGDLCWSVLFAFFL